MSVISYDEDVRIGSSHRPVIGLSSPRARREPDDRGAAEPERVTIHDIRTGDDTFAHPARGRLNAAFFRLVDIEPTRTLHPALTRAAAARGVSLDVRPTGAEATGLPPASVDAVVCTLVLCTVPDPAAAREEVGASMV